MLEENYNNNWEEKMFLYLAIPLITAFSGLYLWRYVSVDPYDSIYGFLLGLLIGVRVIVVYDIERNRKKLNEISGGQLEVTNNKKFKLYHMKKALIPIALIFLAICATSFIDGIELYTRIFICINFIIFVFLYPYKEDILFYKKDLDYKYGIIDEQKESFNPKNIESKLIELSKANKELSEEEKENFGKLKLYSEIYSAVKNYSGITNVENSNVVKLEFFRGRNKVNIGTISTIYWNRPANKYDNTTRYTLREDIFISLTLPFSFKNSIKLEKGGIKNRIENINDENVLIPRYRNIPLIFCDDKSYAEKIMDEKSQEEIAKLVSKINSAYTIKFYENTVLIVIFNTKWSTYLSRKFSKKKNFKNICEVIDEVNEKISKIAIKIENDEIY